MKYSFVDLIGKTIKNGKLKQGKINTSDLKEGVYFLRLYDDFQIIGTRKVVISR